MKLKINKASDLSSLSVLPPHSRRPNAAATGAESSIFGKSQASQLRLQQSQQSFSQGTSSQHGIFSQLSQNSLNDVLTNDQRIGSQERESSGRKASCLPPMNYPREESQMQVPRSNTTNLMREWSVPEYKCQISEELEHRIGMMETSLSRFGMILDSIQSDIMQANKGTKEVALEMESIRQKITIHDDLLQLMNKGLEDIKVCFERGLKALSAQFEQNMFQESSREISLKLSALPGKVETCILQSQSDLIKSFTREIQAMACSLKVNPKCATPVVHPPKGVNHHSILQEIQSLNRYEDNDVMGRCFMDALAWGGSMPLPSKGHHTTSVPKIEMAGWKTVKHERSTSKDKNHDLKKSNQKRVSPIQLDRERKLIVESDEDVDGGFFSLFKEKERGIYSIEDAQQETERILRKARRRKRKHYNLIILD